MTALVDIKKGEEQNMKVKLLAITPNLLDVLYTSARTCYNAGSPIDMWSDLDKSKKDKASLIFRCYDSRHLSVLEHSQFTFAIEGISRACSHQLVRHRLCAFSQQSQRYVEIKEDKEKLIKLYTKVELDKLFCILDKYFIYDRKDLTWYHCYETLWHYLELIDEGSKPEDARAILPNCTKTNLVMTCNLRELIHICNERMCTKAQKEIRQLVNMIAKEVINQEDWLKPLLLPKCYVLKGCPESKSCGRYKKEEEQNGKV